MVLLDEEGVFSPVSCDRLEVDLSFVLRIGFDLLLTGVERILGADFTGEATMFILTVGLMLFKLLELLLGVNKFFVYKAGVLPTLLTTGWFNRAFADFSLGAGASFSGTMSILETFAGEIGCPSRSPSSLFMVVIMMFVYSKKVKQFL